MRWFTTFLLIVLVAGGALWLLFGDTVRRSLGIAAATEANSKTNESLKDQIKPDTLKRIERTIPEKESVVLLRNADKEWTEPGNWPVRQAEANELAAALADIRTRFLPIAIASGADLKPYGLDPSQKPVAIRLDAAAKTLTLTFGQAPAVAGDSAFGRATYLRLDDQPEVLRLGPDVYAAVTKPADAYRRRQLFPDVNRLKLVGGEPPPNPMNPTPPAIGRAALPSDKAVAIKVEGPAGGFAIKRDRATPAATVDPERPASEPTLNANHLASVWELTEISDAGKPAKPFRDRVDPAKLRSLLTAIPEIWAEQFVTGKTNAETGLDKPERSVSISFASGGTASLRIGKVSRRTIKDVAPPPAQPFAPQPPPQPKIEEYYYAKLDNNPLVFEIRGDKFNDLFAAADEVRDASLARFESSDVTELTIARKDQPPIKITKKKGNKDAEKEDDKQDRWYLDGRLAEASKITELLDSLGRLEAKGKEDRIDDADAKKLGELGLDAIATKVTVVTSEKSGATSTTTFVFGKHDAEKKKLDVQVAGWPRVNVVADDVVKLIDRPALAYRGRRLFDTAEAKLTGVSVAGAEAFSIKQNGEKKWQIVQPVSAAADEAKASELAGNLSRLEAIDYVDDAPKPEDLDKKYGLAKPALSLKLAFEGGKEQTLDIGKSPEFQDRILRTPRRRWRRLHVAEGQDRRCEIGRRQPPAAAALERRQR